MGVLRSPLAGSWFPAEPSTLRDLVDRLLAEAVSQHADPGYDAYVVPHAGYQYSGSVAAAAYRLVARRKARRVVVLAPCHRMRLMGLAVPRCEGFETPLGTVWVDPIVASIGSFPLVRIDSSPFDGEHSFEIQLPFLQRALPEAKVVPILCGSLRPQDDSTVAAVLARLAGDDTLFLLSSDFTHYGASFGYEPFPATSAQEVKARLEELDMSAIAPVLTGDVAAFRTSLARTGATVCGRYPLAAFLSTLKPGAHGDLLAYRTSLDVTGDYTHCVSYASIGLTGAMPG